MVNRYIPTTSAAAKSSVLSSCFKLTGEVAQRVFTDKLFQTTGAECLKVRPVKHTLLLKSLKPLCRSSLINYSCSGLLFSAEAIWENSKCVWIQPNLLRILI